MWNVIIALAIAYLAASIFLYFNQENMLYFPDMPLRSLHATPSSIELDYETITLKTHDGIALDSWFVPAKNSKGTILFCHGNAGNISHRLHSIEQFHQLGLSVFIFDYRGYGNSEGSPSEQGTYIDAKTAWDHLTNEMNIPDNDIIIFGRSLGSAIATELATKTSPKTLIIESSFTSVPDIASHHYSLFPVRLLSRYTYPTEENIQKVSAPILVIHSPDDEIIPYELGKQNFDKAAQPKYFLEIKGGHNDGPIVTGKAYSDGILQFLSTL